MKHSIILWDCCYRNFFHLTGSLAEQGYPRDQYEIIWVEQRSRAASDEFNHRIGLRSLADTVALYADRCDVRAVFLDQPRDRPYHIGVCVNAGTALARGEIISRMDGDMLVKPDFLHSVDREMAARPGVLNMIRRCAVRPVGAPLERWTEGVVDYDLCRAECPRADGLLPLVARNKGPCITAPRAWVDAVGGYDEHELWATGISRNGQDLTARMEIYSGVPSRALPGHLGVHPYHPGGLNRLGETETAIFDAQQSLIDWSLAHAEPTLAARQRALEETYAGVRGQVEQHLRGPKVAAAPKPSALPRRKTFVHLVNPLVVTDPASDLASAQPVTFASMTEARAFADATQRAEVFLCAASFPEDRAAIPPDFEAQPDLTRSVLDVGKFETPRKLPLLADLIARALDAADRLCADWIIYTNVDIAPMPDFYAAVARLIEQGNDAFTINRRTIRRNWPKGMSDLPLMRARIGQSHPGRDCFVFAREAAREFDCGLTCIGATAVGKVLAANMLRKARRYEEFADLHLTFHLGNDRSWFTPELHDYAEHNRRELAAVLERLDAAPGHAHPAHPAWEQIRRISAKGGG